MWDGCRTREVITIYLEDSSRRKAEVEANGKSAP